MNKRTQKKLEKQAELAHEGELKDSSWGRITLSYEHLRDALEAFVTTLAEEAQGVAKAAQQRLSSRTRTA